MSCAQSPPRGEVCLIAGTTGIAAAAARLAAARGTALFLVGRTPEHGEALRDELRETGAEVEFCAADLTDPAAPDRILAAAVQRFGRVDTALNVAGISGRRFGDGPAHECTADGWDTVMDTNARGMFLLCGALLRQFLGQTPGPGGLRGSILNMASVLAWSPSPTHFATHAYAASKAAIIGFSRAMAAHYAPRGIRVNVIAPALVRTPMSQRAQQDPAILHFLKTKQPLTQDLIDAEQVARAALFLLSADAAAITGDVLVVDAGWCVSEGQAE